MIEPHDKPPDQSGAENTPSPRAESTPTPRPAQGTSSDGSEQTHQYADATTQELRAQLSAAKLREQGLKLQTTMLRQRHQKVTLHEDRRRSQIESKLSKELVETKAALQELQDDMYRHREAELEASKHEHDRWTANVHETRYALDDPKIVSLMTHQYLRGYLDANMVFEQRKAYRQGHSIYEQEIAYLNNTEHPRHPFQQGMQIGYEFTWRTLCREQNKPDWDNSLDTREWSAADFSPLTTDYKKTGMFGGTKVGAENAEKAFSERRAEEQEHVPDADIDQSSENEMTGSSAGQNSVETPMHFLFADETELVATSQPNSPQEHEAMHEDTPASPEQTRTRLVIKGTRKKPTKQDLLSSRVRDSTNQTWVAVSELSQHATDHFKAEAVKLARAGTNWKEFSRLLVRPDRFDGAYCVQCNVISHTKHLCDLKDGDTACSRCENSGRACAKLIQIEGQSYLGWLPLSDADKGRHAWEELPYWIVHEEVKVEPVSKRRR
jgi:hypothetical protein